MANGFKSGGRKKGTPNKLTYETRQVLVNLVNHELENLPDLLKAMDPKDRVEVVTKLIPYALPKMVPQNPSNAEREGLEIVDPDLLDEIDPLAAMTRF